LILSDLLVGRGRWSNSPTPSRGCRRATISTKQQTIPSSDPIFEKSWQEMPHPSPSCPRHRFALLRLDRLEVQTGGFTPAPLSQRILINPRLIPGEYPTPSRQPKKSSSWPEVPLGSPSPPRHRSALVRRTDWWLSSLVQPPSTNKAEDA